MQFDGFDSVMTLPTITVRYRHTVDPPIVIAPYLIPAILRSRNKKTIIVNGVKKGYGVFREGPPPINLENYTKADPLKRILSYFSSSGRFAGPTWSAGFIFIRIVKQSFIILKRESTDGNFYYEVFEKRTGRFIAHLAFSISQGVARVSSAVQGYETTAMVMLGYIMDCTVPYITFSSISTKIDLGF